MRAGLRLGVLMAVAGLMLGTAAHGQDTAPATTNTPATDTIGPRELQNFSLPGTVTRPAEEPAPQRAAPAAERPAPPSRSSASTGDSPRATPAPQPTRQATATAEEPSRRVAAEAAPGGSGTLSPSLSSVTVRLPPPTTAPSPQDSRAGPGFADEAQAAPFIAPDGELPIWPWLFVAMALGAGGAFLFWRNRARGSYAGGPQIDAFVAPEPAARPRASVPVPKAAPPQPVPPVSSGIVTTRLRPWMDIGFEPARCIVEEDRVRLDFQLDLFNSGSGPARDVLIEAVLINASGTQEQEIAAFFARTDGAGERMPVIAPLQRITLRPQVVLPMDQVRVLEAAGRRVFVPLIAFNVLYSRGGSVGQTSAVYLVGRDTKGEKMAPFRLDLGPRVFRAIAAKALPNAVRN